MSRGTPKLKALGGFRLKLFLSMTLVVVGISIGVLFVAEHKANASAEADLLLEFQGQLAALREARLARHNALAEICKTLAAKARIHAALEDEALDLLYPSASDELRDLTGRSESHDSATRSLHARFCRFLDKQGSLIPTGKILGLGQLTPTDESRLSLPHLPTTLQSGYLVRHDDDTVDEVIIVPINSTDTGEALAALVVGFRPITPTITHKGGTLRSGLWIEQRLFIENISTQAHAAITATIAQKPRQSLSETHGLRIQIDDVPHLLFSVQINVGPAFPPAFEICLYPLTDALERQQLLRWQIVGTCALLILGSLIINLWLAGMFSKPVEQLAVTSETHRAGRERAEAALETTSEELRRSSRFSSDASHQLKTPITVLRAGLDELVSRDSTPPWMREELSGLIHQTYRLTGVVEDLLLLSRLDAGHLKLHLTPIDLGPQIASWLDDLSALPDGESLQLEQHIPEHLLILGEQRYTTMILQNLLENARKYNRPAGRIRISLTDDGTHAQLHIGNTGRTIAPEDQPHIFQRFHRGTAGENVPGHGLGLNLARELALLHGGDLRLVTSTADWTEFSVRFHLAHPVR